MTTSEQIKSANAVRIFKHLDKFYVELYYAEGEYALLRENKNTLASFNSRLPAYHGVLSVNPNLRVLGEKEEAEHTSFVTEVRASLARTELLLQSIAAQKDGNF